MSYKNQKDGTYIRLSYEKEMGNLFTEQMRNDANKAVTGEATDEFIADVMSGLGSMALDYADAGKVAHQSLYFMSEIAAARGIELPDAERNILIENGYVYN